LKFLTRWIIMFLLLIPALWISMCRDLVILWQILLIFLLTSCVLFPDYSVAFLFQSCMSSSFISHPDQENPLSENRARRIPANRRKGESLEVRLAFQPRNSTDGIFPMIERIKEEGRIAIIKIKIFNIIITIQYFYDLSCCYFIARGSITLPNCVSRAISSFDRVLELPSWRELRSAKMNDRDGARISGERGGPARLRWIGPVRERAITSRNNYRLARPRGSPSRLFLHPGIPTTKNTLPGKRLSRYETARERSSEQKKREREIAFRIKSDALRNRHSNPPRCSRRGEKSHSNSSTIEFTVAPDRTSSAWNNDLSNMRCITLCDVLWSRDLGCLLDGFGSLQGFN
jgi:hypothetical protein